MSAPSTLYRNGRVRAPTDPFATALLVVGEQVAWVGPESAADALDAAVTIDLEDAWVAPAFVDAHVHATSTGLALTGLDLTDTRSLADALRLVEQHARAGRGRAVLGTGWDETRWPERRPPTAAELDRASYGGVVYLARTDVHSAVVSSALLAACPEVEGLPGLGPGGLVRAEAHHAVRRTALASVTPTQREAAQRAALDRAAVLGIACVHECGGPDISGEADFTALLGLHHGVERVGYWGDTDVDRAIALGAAGAAGDLFVDGSLGSRTAHLCTPYTGTASTGERFLDPPQVVTDGLEQAVDVVGEQALRDARHRVEHVEMVTVAQRAVLARYGVVASVQPLFDERWGGPHGMYAERLGPVRAAFSAHTRGGRRAARQDDQGELAPGTPATFAVWQVEGELVVQAPDDRVAGWSTDAGAGVSGLPDLDAADPVCLRTVVRGVTVHEA